MASEEKSLAEKTNRLTPWYRVFDFDSFLTNFQERFNDLASPFIPTVRSPVIDIIQEDGKYKVVAEIPGVEKDELDVEVENRYLKIKVEREHEEEKEEPGYIKRERGYGAFYRRILLPDDVESDGDIDATLEKGVLEVKIPRRSGEKTRKIDIK